MLNYTWSKVYLLGKTKKFLLKAGISWFHQELQAGSSWSSQEAQKWYRVQEPRSLKILKTGYRTGYLIPGRFLVKALWFRFRSPSNTYMNWRGSSKRIDGYIGILVIDKQEHRLHWTRWQVQIHRWFVFSWNHQLDQPWIILFSLQKSGAIRC